MTAVTPQRTRPPLVDVPNGRWLLGHLPEFRRRPLETMAVWRERYGDFVRFRLGPRTFYLLSGPSLAEEVLHHKPDVFVKVYDARKPTGLALVLGNGLLTSSGETWRRHRRMIQPLFPRSHVTMMAERMVDVGERLLERWARRNPEEPFDIAFEMMQTTLEIIAQTMASTSLARHVPALEPSLRVLLRYAFHAFHNPLRLPTWVPTRTN